MNRVDHLWMCRYVNNLQQAERLKKPNSGWWNKTLKPLRSVEVAVTKAHLAKSSESFPSAPSNNTLAEGAGPSKPAAKKVAGLPSFSAPKQPQPFAKLRQEVGLLMKFSVILFTKQASQTRRERQEVGLLMSFPVKLITNQASQDWRAI